MADVSATTLVIANAPTLSDGLAELLNIASAYRTANRLGWGVWVQRAAGGWLLSAEPDYDVPAKVIETSCYEPPDPWAAPVAVLTAIAELTDLDVVATADGVYLQ